MSELKAFREKYWEERTQEEKIEALAETVRTLAETCYRLRCNIDDMQTHAHDSSGRVMVVLDRNRESGYGYHQYARLLEKQPKP